MATNDEVIDMAKTLTVLSNEEELIIKPFQPGMIKSANKIVRTLCFFLMKGYANEIGAIECGKIVSRINKVLFDYQIGKRIKI